MGSPSGWRARWAAQVPHGAERRSGQVLALATRPGRIAAQVQGGAAAPYHVEVLVDQLDDAAWQRAVDVVAGQARHRAALHAGHLSEELAADLAAAGADLVAVQRLDPRCPCRAGVSLCRHAAAVWAALGDRAAADPFVLTQLRGRGRQQLLAALSTARRRDADGDAATVAVSELDVSRWHASPADDAWSAERWAGPPAGAKASLSAASLRLLGDPAGWRGPADATDTFGPMVAAGAQHAAAIRDRARRLDHRDGPDEGEGLGDSERADTEIGDDEAAS